MAWEDELGGILNKMYMYFRGKPPNEAQVAHWVTAFEPYKIWMIRPAVEQAINAGRGMPTVDDVMVYIRTRSQHEAAKTTLSDGYQPTDQEREFNSKMFVQVMRFYNREITIEQLIINSRHYERKYNIPPLDWSKFDVNIDEQIELL